METLSEMFQLEIPTVHSIISKMIINEELMVRSFCIRVDRTCCSLFLFIVTCTASFRIDFFFVFSDRHHLTSQRRQWSCTAQSPHPCRTWPCSWLRSWAAWWRIMSGSLISNKACMEVTSTEVRSPSLLPLPTRPWILFLAKVWLQLLKTEFCLDTIWRFSLCYRSKRRLSTEAVLSER